MSTLEKTLARIEHRLETVERLLQESTDDVLDIGALHKLTGLSKSAIYRKTCSLNGGAPQLPHFKQGKRLYFRRSEILQWLMQKRIDAHAQIEREIELANGLDPDHIYHIPYSSSCNCPLTKLPFSTGMVDVTCLLVMPKQVKRRVSFWLGYSLTIIYHVLLIIAMIFRIWSFADITLTDQQDEQTREFHRSQDEHGDSSDHYKTQPLSDVEKELRRAYHAATSAHDRMDVLEAWALSLLRTWGDMTDQEQKLYRHRVKALLRIARTMLAIEARRAKLELYEDHLGAVDIPSRKIILHTWKDELTRIHEAARAADLYADTTTVAQIVGMYHVERLPKDIEASYRSSRSRTESHKTPSEKFLTFIKKLVRQLTPASREKLIDYCLNLPRFCRDPDKSLDWL